MKPNISEFSYGFAITDELVNWNGARVSAAPVFPSLYAEGRSGGGFDVKIPTFGVPLFLQFKLCDCMKRRNAYETRRGILHCPFYRMHLRPQRHSNQHPMLLELENRGNIVYYCAPAFHDIDELNVAYLSRQVANRSIWIKPSQIGSLDNESHCVSFETTNLAYLWSEPQRIKGEVSFDATTIAIADLLRSRGRSALLEEELNKLSTDLRSIGQMRTELVDSTETSAKIIERDRPVVEQIAYYAAMYFELQMYIVTE